MNTYAYLSRSQEGEEDGGEEDQETIKTDYLPPEEWYSLSYEERQSIIKARAKVGIKRKIDELQEEGEEEEDEATEAPEEC